jgi:DNA-binding response OmpR family regulator
MVAGHAHRRVTVLDDSPELLALIGDALRFDGVDVSLFDGSATLEEIAESVPDLLMIDLRLRSDSLSGLDLIRLVRRHRALRHVPIIVCSAAREGLREHEKELGQISDLLILQKPFALQELESCVDEALGQRVDAPILH